MINLHESMGPDRDRTRDPWICSQTRIRNQTRYRLRYAARYGVSLAGRWWPDDVCYQVCGRVVKKNLLLLLLCHFSVPYGVLCIMPHIVIIDGSLDGRGRSSLCISSLSHSAIALLVDIWGLFSQFHISLHTVERTAGKQDCA